MNTIHHSTFLYNQFKKLNLCNFYSNRVIHHFMSILISIFLLGYHEKPRTLLETVLAIELQLHISLILESGMTPYFLIH